MNHATPIKIKLEDFFIIYIAGFLNALIENGNNLLIKF
jgi:hypothetical protein